MSRLAEVYDGGATRLSAADIAESRGFPRPMIAKILSILSQAGLVSGSPGPRGGFTLASDPGEIKVFDVFTLFERQEEVTNCPFGGGVCGGDDPCPLHERLVNVKEAMDQFLHETTFAIFHKPSQ